MTRDDLLKIQASENLGNPQRRDLDFLLRRVGASDTADTSSDRAIGEDATTAQDPPVSMAEKRLQQLYLFREKQQQQADTSNEFGARDFAESGKLNWTPIGPFGVDKGQAGSSPVISGRIKDIAIANGGERIYIASANGGVWFTNNAGKHWSSLMDGLNYFPNPLNTGSQADSLSCGALALVQGEAQHNDKIFVGTGEGSGNLDAYMGVGVLMSSNGGMNWITETSNPVSLVGTGFFSLIVDPDTSERVLAATRKGIFIREHVAGTTYNWAEKAFAGKTVWSLVVAGSGPNKRFFASVSDVGGAQIFHSPDGIAWTPLPWVFPAIRFGRTSLAVQANNPNIVYAMVALSGVTVANPSPAAGLLVNIYRLDMSTDSIWYPIVGATAADTTLITGVFGGGQGWYDNVMAVAPDNINRIIIGGAGLGNGAQLHICNLVVTPKAGGAAGVDVKASVSYIGANVHADVHALVFVPNEPEKFWVGCDGGAFYTEKISNLPTPVFQSRNLGLQTMTFNYMGLYPNEESYFFTCAQDNGCQRYFGDDVWLHSFPGDAGYCVINYMQPHKVVTTYTNAEIMHSIVGGNKKNDGSYDVVIVVDPVTGINTLTRKIPIMSGATVEEVLFYAPLVAVPFKTGLTNAEATKQSNILAFGTQRPWISTDFGLTWKPIPSLLGADLPSFNMDILWSPQPPPSAAMNFLFAIQTMAFASVNTLYVGTNDGQVFQYKDAVGTWSVTANIIRTSLNTAADRPPAGQPITGIAALNDTEFYVTVGGAAGTQRVWHCNTAAVAPAKKWTPRSTGLIDVHFNTIAINPTNTNHLYAGSDVGVWRSTDKGVTWETFSFGLPETPVIDLKVFNANGITLLRASTHGRGIYECLLSEATTPDVKLYIRAYELDSGRYKIKNNLLDPRKVAPSVNIAVIDSPDIPPSEKH